MQLDRDVSLEQSLAIGMYVRFPFKAERSDNEFRDFRIGQIRGINTVAHSALVRFNSPDEDVASEVECSLNHIDRCRILPDTLFTTMYVKRPGRILIHCNDEWIRGQFLDYYVLLDGEKEVKRISEAEIRVPSTRQNPSPDQQLRRYEFQNPTWKSLRDQVIESYSPLRNATFGIEDLVGSRIMLLAHQAEVVARVLSDVECRYILADEVSLGKTIEACVILKGLMRRNKELRALIVAPSSLAQQWHNELNTKFWLDFPVIRPRQNLPTKLNSTGYMVATEELYEEDGLWAALSRVRWGLLIVDEAHHLRKSPALYQHVRHLSALSERVLILSATPIQRRAREYLKLLALMHPQRYDPEDIETFQTLLSAQGKIRRKIAAAFQNLDPDDFDPEEFEEELEVVAKSLNHDRLLAQLIARVPAQAHSYDRGLKEAKDVLAYVSENYRIESRVIRNRRAHLHIQLPERKLNTSYSYVPDEEEAAVLDALYDYVDVYARSAPANPLTSEYCRALIHAASSSPHALLHLLEVRSQQLMATPDIPLRADIDHRLTTSASPREEAQRLATVMAAAPSLPGEHETYLEALAWRVMRWAEQTDEALAHLSGERGDLTNPSSHRLGQVLRALDSAIKATPDMKVIVFSTWPQTLAAFLPHLVHRYGSAMVARFTAQLDMERLQDEAVAFQSSDRCRILLCDELGGEGRNFQIASQIIHIDLTWTPAQLEQRIGRVDRFGREGTVLSIVPFAQNWPEQDLFRIWQSAFHLFTQSMSGLEIALETIQDRLSDAICQSSREGIANLVDSMIEEADKLRQAVEEERYFEEAALNRQRRNEFERISEEYSDGKKLGLNLNKMKNAKFFHPPDMQEALRRSGRAREIRGTFDRNVAVRREDLVFFAPGSDKWMDAIITNALEADRGRCCAIKRRVHGLKGDWHGVELLYSLAIDPRPLYAAGFIPTHLFRALGFLRSSLYRLLISADGQPQDKNSIEWKIITKNPYDNSHDIHLGRREGRIGAIAQIQAFRELYPAEEWDRLLENVFVTAEKTLDEELEFMADEAEDAKVEFAHRAAGWRASHLWLQHVAHGAQALDDRDIEEYERISDTLIEGIRHPLRQLESACFWILEGGPLG
jgi:ATP-dependent helicase HepA